MPFYTFVWDDENEAHLAEHDVSIDEFAEVVCDPDFVEESRSSGRPISGTRPRASTSPVSTNSWMK